MADLDERPGGNGEMDWEEADKDSSSDENMSAEEAEDLILRLESNDPEIHGLGVGYPANGDFLRFGRAIGQNNQLRELSCDDVGGEAFSSLQDFENFFSGVSGNRSIRSLILGCDLFGGEAFSALTPFFRGNQNLERLEIEGGAVSNGFVRSLSSALLEFDSLKEFRLDIDGIIDDSDESGWAAFLDEMVAGDLIRALVGHANLGKLVLSGHGFHTLNLVGAHIDNRAAAVVAMGLAGSSDIEALWLSENYAISLEGWQALFASLQQNRVSLSELVLSHTRINDAVVPSLVDALTSTDIFELSLKALLHVTGDGWLPFFDFLQSPNCTLGTLELAGNRIDDGTIGVLTNALVRNSRLQELQAWGLNVSPRGWRAFSPVLQSRESVLEALTIGHSWDRTCIDAETLASLANALTGNTRLTELNILQKKPFRSRATNVWRPFSPMLCDPSSIETTLNSNHTLASIRIGADEARLPKDVNALLELNRDNSPSEAARLKIIKTHCSGTGFVEAPPFGDMELALRPHVLAWMGRGGESGEVDGPSFEFLRGTLGLFVAGAPGDGLPTERNQDGVGHRNNEAAEGGDGEPKEQSWMSFLLGAGKAALLAVVPNNKRKRED